MKLSVWAKKQGISYQTAHRWFKEGRMPCEAIQMPTGTIIVKEDNNSKSEDRVVVYCRVSTYERKDCLNGQVQRCSEYANSIGLTVDKVYKEIASGMNDKRKKLIEMLEYNPTVIIVENKDSLTRFGFNYLNLLLNKLGCKIIVLNNDDNNETDIMKDLISIITSFCCRLYGMRRGMNKAKEIKKDLINNEKEL